eukprot:5240454-Pleurochrysis_carterae.AAC.2
MAPIPGSFMRWFVLHAHFAVFVLRDVQTRWLERALGVSPSETASWLVTQPDFFSVSQRRRTRARDADRKRGSVCVYMSCLVQREINAIVQPLRSALTLQH